MLNLASSSIEPKKLAARSAELASAIKLAMKADRGSYWPVSFARKQASNSFGEELGHDAARCFAGDTIGGLVAQLSAFWTSAGLGEMRVVHTDPLLIEVKNCYDCTGWSVSSPGSSCAFKASFIKTVFKDVLKRPVRIEEMECCRRPGPACLFRVSTD